MRIPSSIITTLRNGGVGVMPTDTVYGLVGIARSPEAVERIFKVRKRNIHKPFIILISHIDEIELFGVHLNVEDKKILGRIWPGPVSVVLPCGDKKFRYLHRGKKSLAFRLGKVSWLHSLIKKTGPLVAPSANPSGLPTASSIAMAKKYFKKDIDFYVAGKVLSGLPSTVIRLKNGKVIVEREGVISKTDIRKMVS